MNFKAELEKLKKQKGFKNIYDILKLGTKSEYLQLQLHFEDISNNFSNELKNTFEKKYLSEYNIIPHSWDLPKLKSFQDLETSNIGYILASNNITRKDILDNKGKNSVHSDFYKNGFTREAIFDIFKSEILDKKSKRNKLKSSYVNFYELSRNDIRVMAENYIQIISYYIKNEQFIEDLKKLN